VIYPILSNSFESNAFIITGEKACIIDPGINPRRVLSKFDEFNIVVDVLINTHCHYDHCACNAKILENKGIDLVLHEIDATAIEKGDENYILSTLFGKDIEGIKVDLKVVDGQTIDLGDVKLEIIHTPGHTMGSICIYEPDSKSLFTGDTLFREGI